MVSDDDDLDCPLCMEEFDIADRNFRPCPCGYQICRFCWHHIKSNLNGRCPACRRMYSDQIAQFIPVSADEIVRLKKEKKEKERQNKDMNDSSRRHLSNVRVVQKNLVYVLGLSSKYASIENEFFKKYGKIAKLVLSKRSTQQTSSQPSSSVGIYVTYCRKEDAAKAIAGINGSTCDNRSVRASYGTTKYCTYYLRHMPCPNPNCMYLHEPGDDVDSYTKDNLSIGKHPSGSGNQTYPNKRITPTCSTSTVTATASTATASTAPTSSTSVQPKPSARSSTSVDAQADVPRKSAWAPIPKVVPPPPPPAPEPEPELPVEIQEPEPEPKPEPKSEPKPEPSLPKPSSSSSEQTNSNAATKSAPEKATKPIAIEKKPALPATASWGKGANNLASSHESTATSTNFGPSLSDALTASQKPKHTPSIPRKKEKKLKSKMIRLEDFEEGVRSTSKQGKSKKEPSPPESALSAQISRQQQQGSPWKPIQMPSQDVKPAPESAPESGTPEASAFSDEPGSSAKAAPIETKEDNTKETDHMEVGPPVKVEQVFHADKVSARGEEPPVMESVQEEQLALQNEKEMAAKTNGAAKKVEEEDAQMSTAKFDTDEDIEHEDDERHDSSSDDMVIEDKTAALDQFTSLHESPEQPSFANYVLGSLMVDDDDRNSEEALGMEGGLSNLKGDLDSEYDVMLGDHDHDRHNVLDEIERSEKVQEDDHPEFTSPLLAMERFSALINQELASNSPERPMDDFDRRPMPYQPPSLFQELGLPFESNRPHCPPPGIPGPPEWRSHNFDPFNGQDPAAARRLQHSQQMLEASGLFPGFAPRPPPMFGVSPDFHASGTPPPPPPPQGPPPPPGMFGLPPAPMMHHPEFMNMPPGLGPMMDKSDMVNLENSMRGMNMQQNGHNESLRNMQDDLRALLPNVNISFGPMRDDNPPSNKPHTPSHDEPEFLHRRPSDSHRMQPRFEMNHFNEPRDMDRFSPSPLTEEKTLFSSNGSTHKPDALPENEYERFQEERRGDMKQEAQNFFGEFLRKAAATGSAPMHMTMAEAPRKASLPFQDPAIMSVRMSGEGKQPQPPPQDITESQNTILQILGGQPPPQQHREQMLLNQAMRSPPEDAFGREMPPKPFDFFMAQQQHQQQQQQHHHQQQQQQHHQQQQQPSHQHQHPHQHPPPPMPFHHHQPPPAHPPPFMSGYMGVMPPPHYHHHMQDPPPGMMPMPPQPPPPLPLPMQVDMGYRPRNGSLPGNFPPGLFPGSGRHDGM